jgi:hypothetical protein
MAAPAGIDEGAQYTCAGCVLVEEKSTFLGAVKYQKDFYAHKKTGGTKNNKIRLCSE